MSEEAEEMSVDYGEVEETQADEQVEETQEAEQPEGETAEQKEERHRVEFTEEQQKFINENIVGRQVAKRKEAEQKLEEYQRRLEALEQQSQTQQDGEPVVPDPPNIWDDNYEEKTKERDEALIRHAEWRAEQKTRQEWEQRQAWEQQQKHQETLLKQVQTYTERAQKDYGIDPNDLQVAGNAVSQFGINEDLTKFILNDDAGPAITMHLSRNIAELEQLNSMDPIQAAVYIATEIKPRATRNAKRRAAPPEPVDNPKGGGVPEKDRGPKGAVYE